MELTGRLVLAVAAAATVMAVLGGAPPADAQAPPPPPGGQVQPPPPPPEQFQPGQPPLPRQHQSRRGALTVPTPRTPTGPAITLPAPKLKGDVSVEQALSGRHTLLAGKPGPITLQEASQLLWAAQGITGQWYRRAAPSAGAAYPIEVILVAGDVTGLPAGVYRYFGGSSQVERLVEGDKRTELGQIARWQGIEQAPAVVVVAGVEARSLQVFQSAQVAHTFVAMEAGAVAQNLMLAAVGLGLGTAEVSDSDPAKLARLLRLANDETPFAVVLVSHE